MAKSSSNKSTTKSGVKSPVAFASTTDTVKPSAKNSSKINPGEDVNMDVQTLGSEDGLMKLFTDSIKDLYWAENHLTKALPKMANAAGSSELSDAILKHLDQTMQHVERLGQVFQLLGHKPMARKCDAMEGLTKEGEAVVEETDQGTSARDLGIIMASQKVEHYEIAAYTGLVKLGTKLGLQEIADLLSETLTEEQDADATLAGIADNSIELDNDE